MKNEPCTILEQLKELIDPPMNFHKDSMYQLAFRVKIIRNKSKELVKSYSLDK